MSNFNFGKIARWTLVAIIFGSIIAVAVWSFTAEPETNHSPAVAWNTNMTLGNPDAENHFIVYADSMCPYCASFSLTLNENIDRFKADYIDNNKIYLEVRLADIISSHNVNSHRANTAAYCAAEEGKFWEFYPALQTYLDKTFYKKGASATQKIKDDVYIEIADKNGIDRKKFASCLDSDKIEQDLARASNKATNLITGAPYFVFGKYKSSGFPQNGGYETIQQMIRAGGVK